MGESWDPRRESQGAWLGGVRDGAHTTGWVCCDAEQRGDDEQEGGIVDKLVGGRQQQCCYVDVACK